MIGDQKKKKKKKKQHLQGIRSTSLHPVLTPNLKNEHVLSFFPSLRLQSTFDMQTDRRHFNRANWSQCCAGSIGSNTLAGFLKARSIFQSTAVNPTSYEMPLILSRNTELKDDFPSTAAEPCSSLLTACETKWTILLRFPLALK